MFRTVLVGALGMSICAGIGGSLGSSVGYIVGCLMVAMISGTA